MVGTWDKGAKQALAINLLTVELYIGLGLDDMTIIDGYDEVNDPRDISMLIKQRNGVTLEDETLVEEHEGYNTEYFLDATEVEYQDPDDF
jgi:hypothetical protein